MTTITINNDYVLVKGHSGYAERGKDIVCAAISTLVEATYNYLIATGNNMISTEDDGYFAFKLKEPYLLNQSGIQILNKFYNMILDLEKQFPKYIKIEGERGKK